MSNINLVIVPVWLNLIQKELGIDDADLAVYEKLSGILSPRDLLIYQMVNFMSHDALVFLGAKDMKPLGVSMKCPLPTPTLMERAAMGNQSIETLVFGATAGCSDSVYPVVDVQLVDTELVVVRAMRSDNAPDSVKECSDSLATKITKVLHGRIPLCELAATNAFKQHVQDVQINPVFY